MSLGQSCKPQLLSEVGPHPGSFGSSSFDLVLCTSNLDDGLQGHADRVNLLLSQGGLGLGCPTALTHACLHILYVRQKEAYDHADCSLPSPKNDTLANIMSCYAPCHCDHVQSGREGEAAFEVV